MPCLMRRVPLAVLFFAASWLVTTSAPLPTPSPEPRYDGAAINKYHNALLGAVGEFIKNCTRPAFTNVSSEMRSLDQACAASRDPRPQGGWGQGTCTPECRDSIDLKESMMPGCEMELDIAEALLAKNMTRAFLSNGTLPKGDAAAALTAVVQLNQPAIPDDFFTSKENGVSLWANETFSRVYLNYMTGFTVSSFLDYYQGCTTFPIQDMSESTVLNVTSTRTIEEKIVLDQYLAKLAKFRSQLVEEFGAWLPEQCRGSEYLAPSYDYLELAMKCNNALSNEEYRYPSAEATCPEDCIQFSTISEKELPECQVAEDLLISALGIEWSQMYISQGKLPSDGDPELMEGSQNLFVRALNLGGETQYPTDFFDQEDRREEYATNFTRAIGFLQTSLKDFSTSFATNYHLGCYRKDPKMSTAPGGINQVPPETSSAFLMGQISTLIFVLWFMVLL